MIHIYAARVDLEHMWREMMSQFLFELPDDSLGPPAPLCQARGVQGPLIGSQYLLGLNELVLGREDEPPVTAALNEAPRAPKEC
jgi:hypothetical protein